MIFTKRAHQSAKFQTFDCSGEISPNLYFDRLLLLKVYKISATKVQRSYVSWYWTVMQSMRKNRFVVSKITRIWWILIQVSKICILIGPFRAKYITLDPKKYRGVIFHDTKESCKIWRKTDLWFGKWNVEFSKFLSEHLKESKLVLSQDLFVRSRKCMSLKFTGELCVMTMKNDAKFEVELTCQFKVDMMNLTNFDPNTEKSQRFAF